VWQGHAISLETPVSFGGVIRLGRELCCDDLAVRRPSSRESVIVCERDSNDERVR
jgi:hypothetical protein